jgi:hypothetical protein
VINDLDLRLRFGEVRPDGSTVRRDRPDTVEAFEREALRDSVKRQRDGRPRSEGVPERVDGVDGDEPSPVQDADTVTDRLDLTEDMTGEEHGPTPFGVVPGDATNFPYPVGVEPTRWFVKYEQVRVSDERDAQGQSLHHALGVAADATVRGLLVEADAVEDVLGRVVGALQVSGELDVPVAGEPLVKPVAVREDTDTPVDLAGLRLCVVAEDRCCPGRRSDVVQKHVDGGGLPGPVRTEEAEHLPLFDCQVEGVNREDVFVVLLRQTYCLDGAHRTAILSGTASPRSEATYRSLKVRIIGITG